MATPPRQPASSANPGLLALVLVLAFAVYANTLFNGFVYDDSTGILDNPYIQNFSHLKPIFTTTVFSFRGGDGESNYYRPLLNVAYLLCHSVFGDLPLGYHLMMVLLNVLAAGLVYFVALRLFREPALALLAAGIFALHPVHSEAVAWIACIADLELAVFYLLAFLCFLRLEECSGRRAAWLHVGMLASFVLALLSKEPAITFPVVATLYEHFFRSDRKEVSMRTRLTRYAGLWLVATGYLVFRVTSMGAAVPLLKHPGVTWPQAALSAFALVAQYVKDLFWPWPLSVAYPFHKSASLNEPRVLSGMLVVLACLVLLALLWRKSRKHAFALLWIFILLAPALNARWMATYVFAERNLYLASAGFSWLIAGGIVWLWRQEVAWKQFVHGAVVAGCAVTAVLAASAIVAHNRDFKDDGSLFRQTLVLHPEASLIRSNLGAWHWSRGQRDEAVRQWHRALQDDPQNAFALANRGLARLEERRAEEAFADLQRAIAIRPKFSAPHVHLARLYAAQGRSADVESEFLRAIEINPFSTSARNSYARYFLDTGRLGDAEMNFRASVENIPNEEGWSGLAEVYTRRQDSSGAERAWKEVTRLNPYASRALFALGKLYLSAGRFAEAEKEFRTGLLMDPTNEEALAALRKLSPPTK